MANIKRCCGQALRGTIGVAKALSGIDRADDATIDRRSTACRSCDRNRRGRCAICGCWVRLKVTIASESCPASPSRWRAKRPNPARDPRPWTMQDTLLVPKQTGPRQRG